MRDVRCSSSHDCGSDQHRENVSHEIKAAHIQTHGRRSMSCANIQIVSSKCFTLCFSVRTDFEEAAIAEQSEKLHTGKKKM